MRQDRIHESNVANATRASCDRRYERASPAMHNKGKVIGSVYGLQLVEHALHDPEIDGWRLGQGEAEVGHNDVMPTGFCQSRHWSPGARAEERAMDQDKSGGCGQGVIQKR